MVLKSILNPDVGVYSVCPIGGVCSFNPAIPRDTTSTLCLYGGGGGGGGGCLSHPISNKRETYFHYISMNSSQPSRCILKP